MLRNREGNTPTPRKTKKLCTSTETNSRTSTSRKVLFDTSQPNKVKTKQWSKSEDIALVQFIALYHTVVDGKGWPGHKDEHFWTKCAAAIAATTKCQQREWNGCRTRCTKYLRQKFNSVHEAEEFFDISYNDCFDVNFGSNTPSASTPVSHPMFSSTPMSNFSPSKEQYPAPSTPGDFCQQVVDNYTKLTKRQRLSLLSQLFHLNITELDIPSTYTPTSFIPLVMDGLKQLYAHKQENTFLHLAKCLQPRPNECRPRIPLDRMPWPMVAYNLHFFAVDSAEECKCPESYQKYMETMYTYFGNKWLSLHCGPMWLSDENRNESLNPEDANSALQKDILATAMEDCQIVPEESVCEDVNREWEMLEDHFQSANTYVVEEGDKKPVTDTVFKKLSASEEKELEDSKTSEILSNTVFNILSASEEKELEESNASDMSAVYGVVPQRKGSRHKKRDPLTAKVNIAGVSKRTLTRRIDRSSFTKDTNIQVEVLQHVKKKVKDGRWWIKADATDIRAGLRESVRSEWTGDVDLADGRLQELRSEYDSRLTFSKSIGLGDRKGNTLQDLICMQVKLDVDERFLRKGWQSSKLSYEKKKKQTNASEDSLFALAWDIEGYKKLNESCLELQAAIKEVITMLEGVVRRCNIPQKLDSIRRKLKVFTRGLFLKKRDAASHILVFMIADERRNMKPYAVPVRALPIKSISDNYIRQLKDQLKNTMKELGMIVVGFVTDGEFNSLRTKGSERPVSIIQLIMEAKSEARSTPVSSIMQYLTLQHDTQMPLLEHPAVPVEDAIWLNDYMVTNNRTFDESIHVLKRKQFPLYYDPYPWIPGKEETRNDCMKSLLTIYIFKYKVNQWGENGVEFKSHLYVPEVDKDTNEYQQDREDHGHLLKRIGQCTRSGTVPNVNLVRFVEALESPDTGLTYTALTGKRKQSVVDVERLLSPAVANFFLKGGYTEEANYVRLVSNWHKATDGRGLDEEVRAKYNKDMLDYILDDWMPWHVHVKDYSTMDPNRPIKGIRGLTREIIVGLIANIESAERRRLECRTRGLPPEHPRAGTTDDVEGFFSILHGLLGKIFDHKTFRDNYRKICNEFAKKVDPDLPYYYWTGSDERYTIGPLPNFNQPSTQGPQRLDKIKQQRRSDPGVFHANRASLPQRGSLTVRAKFHNLPETLPPPPQLD